MAALREQTRRRTPGPRPTGWKIGRGLVAGEEQLEPVIGYLADETPSGGSFAASGRENRRVDAEVAIEIGSPHRFAAALEFVDVTRPPDDFETIVAENIWHVGVSFGPFSIQPPPAILQVPVGPGDDVLVDLGPLGRVSAAVR